MIEQISVLMLFTIKLSWSGLVEVVGEDRGDAAIGERADVERASRDALGACGVDAAIEPQDAKAGAKPLLGMRPIGQHRRDEPFRIRPDALGPAAEPLRRPFSVT